jgi:hypothetical protein
MASQLTDNSITGDSIIFEHLIGKAYRNAKNMDPITLLRNMVDDGVLQIDALVEKAISKIGKIERDSTVGRDFKDGSDAKKAITTWCIERPSGNNSLIKTSVRRVATITNLTHKRGILRCVVAETKTNEIYYFRIPYHAYKGLRTIRIYFDEDGTPKTGWVWSWQCVNFTEMAS